ncbi:MAG: hypothetical protein KJ919_10340 [Verrucomicrobia bacterium]|nr:hypothetical protein [Verrucomicrobiota bacterium]
MRILNRATFIAGMGRVTTFRFDSTTGLVVSWTLTDRGVQIINGHSTRFIGFPCDFYRARKVGAEEFFGHFVYCEAIRLTHLPQNRDLFKGQINLQLAFHEGSGRRK